MKNFNSHRLLLFIAILLAQSNLYIAQSVITPSSISGLKLWLTGDSCKINSSQLIDTIYDLSGNANHATQSTVAFKPTIEPTLFNGHQTILFDGISDYISFNQISNIRTVFWVLKENNLATTNYRCLLAHSAVYDFFRGANKEIWHSSYTNNFILSGQTKKNFNSVNGSSTVLPPDFSVISLVTTGNVSADNFSSDRNIGGYIWDGNLAELIIYDQALTASQVNQIETYLSNKYAPPIQLPNDITVLNSYCDTTIIPVNPNNNEYHNYLWNTGATTPTISINQSGKYWLLATNIFGKTSSDTIIVQFPNYHLPNQSSICTGNSIKWNTLLPKNQFTFLWQNSTTDSLINITQAGNYYTTITDGFGCSVNSNTIVITEDHFPTTTTLGANISLCAGNVISLQTNTTSASTYTWNDGTHNSQLIINATGQYYVAVTNTNNCVAKDTIQVTILGQAPSINFTKSIGCRNSVVSFTNLSIAPTGNTITSSYWNFGNSASATNTTNITNPIHTYLDTGVYVVSLIINTDVGCSNSISQTIHIAPTPTVNFVNGISCQNDSTTFASIISSPSYSIINRQWNFGDATSGAANTSTLSNPKHLYSNQTNYTTRLVATNNAGCKDSITKVIAVKAQVKADFNYTAACSNTLMKFIDNSIVPAPNNTNVRQWNFNSSTATGTVINQFYSVAAVYPVTLTVIGNNGCNSTAIKQVNVAIPPICSFPTISNFCASDSVLLADASTSSIGIQQWLWSHNSNAFASLPSVYFKNTITGNHSIKLKVIDNNGCKDSLTRTVTIYALPVVSFTTVPSDLFSGSTVTLSPNTSTFSAYNWTGSNNFSSNSPSPLYSFSDTGKYVFNLQAIDLNGCKNSSQQTLSVNQKRTDLAILDLTPSIQNDGYLSLTVHLANLGTAPINQFKLKIALQNSSQIQETWLGNLNKGTLLDFIVTDLLIPNTAHSGIVCATISAVNSVVADDNLNNNNLCVEVSPNGTSVYEPYPNPSSDVITFPIAVKNDSPILIEITNTLGELVFSEQRNTYKGLNFETISVYGFAKGTYLAKLTIGDKVFTKKIMRR